MCVCGVCKCVCVCVCVCVPLSLTSSQVRSHVASEANWQPWHVCVCACACALRALSLPLTALAPSQVHTLEGHTNSVYSVAFTRGDNGLPVDLLASASQDCTVMVWDPRTWRPCHVIKQHQGEVVGLAWHPQGLAMATGSADMTLCLHPLRSTAPTDADYLAAELARPRPSPGSPGQSDAPSGGAAVRRDGPQPVFMEVQSELGVKLDAGGGGENGMSTRAALAEAAFHRQGRRGPVAAAADPEDVRDLQQQLTAFYRWRPLTVDC